MKKDSQRQLVLKSNSYRKRPSAERKNWLLPPGRKKKSWRRLPVSRSNSSQKRPRKESKSWQKRLV